MLKHVQKLMRSQGCPKAPFHPMCLALTVAGIDSPQSELWLAKQSKASNLKLESFFSPASLPQILN